MTIGTSPVRSFVVDDVLDRPSCASRCRPRPAAMTVDVAAGDDRALRRVVNSIAARAKLETLFEARTMPPAEPLAP